MKQLGALDSAFINLEHPNTPQHLGSISIYDQSTTPNGYLRFKEIINHFENRTKTLPMLRTRLVNSPGQYVRPYWHLDPHFDVEFHVRHIAVPHPGDWRQLCILIARLHSRPLDMSRPLWESYIIEGLDNIPELPDNCFVIYNKLHHSLIDGGGFGSFIGALHDLTPDTPEEDKSVKYILTDIPYTKSSLFTESAYNYVNNFLHLGKSTINLGKATATSLIKLAKGEIHAPSLTGPKTRFNNPVGPYRVTDGCEFELSDIKMIKDVTGTKINDVALAITAGGMIRYLDHYNEKPESSLVATVPLDMRGRKENLDKTNNQLGSVFTPLHTDIDDPITRIKSIHISMNQAKQLGENSPLTDTLKLAGSLSPRITKPLAQLYANKELTRLLPLKINTVISNVAGPPVPLYFNGAKMVRYHGLGVLTPGVGLYQLFCSYCDKLSYTFLADRDILPDPDFYKQCIRDSFEELKEAAIKSSGKGKKARQKGEKQR